MAALALLDIAVGYAFRLPADPRAATSALQSYFDYGRSIEGKLRRLVGSKTDGENPIVTAGWLQHECDVVTAIPRGKLVFDIYGMSFSNMIAARMESLDPAVTSQRFGGPAAPPNHSYACFLQRLDAGQIRAPVQILAVLASSLRRLQTITGLTTSFESPQPFSYPRYSLGPNGRLLVHEPTIASEADLREALDNSRKWNAFLDELAVNDYFYASAVFKADILDYSVVGRMIRRAEGQRIVNARTKILLAAPRKPGAPDLPSVLRAILLSFAQKAREAGARPMIILIEDRGYGGTLTDAAAPALEAGGIKFLTTSAIVSPDDTSNFVPDGHFTPAAFDKIAKAMLVQLN